MKGHLKVIHGLAVAFSTKFHINLGTRDTSPTNLTGLNDGAWRFAKEGGTVEKKSRVPSLTQEGLRNSVKEGVLPFFREVQIQRGAKAPWPQWSRRHWV